MGLHFIFLFVKTYTVLSNLNDILYFDLGFFELNFICDLCELSVCISESITLHTNIPEMNEYRNVEKQYLFMMKNFLEASIFQ